MVSGGFIDRRMCWHYLTHTTPSCLQVEEEDERKKDSGRAHEMELLNTLSCSCSPLYRHTGQDENLQGKVL